MECSGSRIKLLKVESVKERSSTYIFSGLPLTFYFLLQLAFINSVMLEKSLILFTFIFVFLC